VKKCSRLGLLALAGAAGLFAAATARGSQVSISYLTQDRSVSASSSATGFARGGTSSAPVTDVQNEAQHAANKGDFTGDATANSTIGPQGADASATAAQQSSLTSAGFSDSGSVTSDTVFGTGGPANSSSSSVFQITFKVSQAESYTLTVNLGASTDPAEPGATVSTISLANKAGKNVFTPITSVKLSDYTVQGTLKAGTYSFVMDASTISNDANFNSVDYSVSLADGPVLSSVNNVAAPVGTSAVPLPSSGVTALAMLAALGAGGAMRRRLPRWIRLSMV